MTSNLKAVRVLMIGPGEGVTGGISTLVESFLPVLETRVALYYLPSVKRRLMKDSGKLSLQNGWIALSQYARFIGALIRFRPQIIHLHTSQGLAWLKDTFYVLVGKAFRKRIVLHMHGGNFDAIYQGNPGLVRAYTRWILGMSDAVIAVSAEWKARFERILPFARVTPIPNCVDVQAFRPLANHSSNGTLKILFTGRIGPLKGAFDLIDALRLLSKGSQDFQVWMVGQEERAGDFKAAARRLEEYQLDGACELMGSLPREKVRDLYGKADIFVLPSYYEGLPLVILEALAAGLPVIATPVGGIPEVVHDGSNGFLIPPGDVDALKNSLERLIGDADLRQEMGRRSRAIAERELGVDSYVDKITSLYSSLA